MMMSTGVVIRLPLSFFANDYAVATRSVSSFLAAEKEAVKALSKLFGGEEDKAGGVEGGE